MYSQKPNKGHTVRHFDSMLVRLHTSLPIISCCLVVLRWVMVSAIPCPMGLEMCKMHEDESQPELSKDFCNCSK